MNPFSLQSEDDEIEQPDGHGCTGRKLSPVGRAFVIGRILTGDTNARINAALVAAGHLQAGETLSDEMLRRYRRKPEAQFDKRLLTDEARQAGHQALSRRLLQSIERGDLAHAKALQALARTDEDTAPDTKLISILDGVVHRSGQFLWSVLGPQSSSNGNPGLVIAETPEPVTAEVATTDPEQLRAAMMNEMASAVQQIVRDAQRQQAPATAADDEEEEAHAATTL